MVLSLTVSAYSKVNEITTHDIFKANLPDKARMTTLHSHHRFFDDNHYPYGCSFDVAGIRYFTNQGNGSFKYYSYNVSVNIVGNDESLHTGNFGTWLDHLFLLKTS